MIKGTIKMCLKKTHNEEKQFVPGGGDPPWSHFTASLVTKDKITK